MNNSQNVALTIKQLAKNRNIQIKKMLTDCGLSVNTLSTMQSGGSYPRIETIAKIAEYLDCSIDYLLGRTEEPQSNEPVNNGISDDEALLAMIKSLNLVERSKVVLFIDELKNKQQVPNTSQLEPNQSQWRFAARRTDGVYESRPATPEEVEKLKLLENATEPKY